MAGSWTVAAAKARFSELVDNARTQGPQVVTKNGREAVVVVSVEEWRRKANRSGNLAEFLASSPLRDSGVVIEQFRDAPKDVNL